MSLGLFTPNLCSHSEFNAEVAGWYGNYVDSSRNPVTPRDGVGGSRDFVANFALDDNRACAAEKPKPES